MSSSANLAAAPEYPIEIARADLAPYRHSNSGVDYVHSFDSGVPGPHIMVNALTHGNEWSGMHAVKRLLDAQVRPRAGRLTLSFANVAAYEQVGSDGLSVRFVERDFNRLWHDELLATDTTSVEAVRAHQMRPLVQTVDRLLDLHSTWHALHAFFVLPAWPRTRRLADELALPPRQLFLPEFRHDGYHLIDYGGFGAENADAIGLVAECGQHFARTSMDMAWRITVRFLLCQASVDAEQAQRLCSDLAPSATIERYEMIGPVIATTEVVRLACSYAGFVSFAEGELAAMDGEVELLAPFDGAVLLAPRPRPKPGQQAFSWGRRLT